MRKGVYLLVLLLTSAGCSMRQEEVIKLVTNGESGYTIVIPLNAAPSELRAATFLHDHILRISGADLPVVSSDGPLPEQYIHISTTKEIETGDGFSIKTDGDNLLIKGGNQRGCIYGVSELLECCLGVRYYSPGYVVIPQQKSIALPAIDITGSSPNSYRNVNGAFALNADYKDFNRLYHTDDMFAKGYFVHTFNKLVPWEEYFESNPEYYSYMNGKRIIDQLCLTNPEVLRLTIEKLKAEMALQPDKVFWSVSQGDSFSHCQCDECSKIIEEEGSPAGPIIHFVNRVAEEFPDKVISTLAYQYSRKAPKNIRPHDNVQIMLCTIELNRSLPIATDPGSKSFLTDLQDWGRISNHIFLWDYTVDFAHSISPFPNLHTLQPNIRLFVENNVREHFQQTNTGTGHEFSELKAYLLAKLLWNPDANVEEIIREFTDGYYGKGGKWIRKYIASLERELRKSGERLDIYGPPTNHQNTFLSEKNLKRYGRFLDRAEKAASGDSDHHLHIRTATMPLQYAIMEIGKNDMFGPRGWYREVDDDFVVRTEMTSMLESFYQTSIECKSAPVNESGLTPEEYYKATKRFIDVQIRGNLAFRKKVISDPLPAAKYSGGDLTYLTNGVRGANDFKVHWLGWEAQNFSLTLDLEELVDADTIEISSLWEQKSWILHPASVTCLISEDGIQYLSLEKQTVEGDQRHEDVTRLYSFNAEGNRYRFVKFEVEGTLRLFDWHPSAGGGSWVFIDEIVVR
jgi:hypothetical protein